MALPPARAICSPASAAASLGAEIATSGMPGRLSGQTVDRDADTAEGLAAEAGDLGLEVERLIVSREARISSVSRSAGTSQLTSNSMPSGSLAYNALVVP